MIVQHTNMRKLSVFFRSFQEYKWITKKINYRQNRKTLIGFVDFLLFCLFLLLVDILYKYRYRAIFHVIVTVFPFPIFCLLLSLFALSFLYLSILQNCIHACTHTHVHTLSVVFHPRERKGREDWPTVFIFWHNYHSRNVIINRLCSNLLQKENWFATQR